MPITKKFQKLLTGTEEYYTGKKVPRQFQKKYGKTYSKEESKSIAYAIARSRGWRT